MLNFDDKTALDSFVKQELENPSPRKEVGDSIVYASRLFRWPTGGEPVLSDFGSAERGDAQNTRNAGPDLYRAPEVMLGMEWGYSVDIWNIGVMVWCSSFREFDEMLTFCRFGICLKEGHSSLHEPLMRTIIQLMLTFQK